MHENKKLKTFITLALLIALQVILSRVLSIALWNVKIGFSFLPVALAGMLYGPFGGIVVGACSDFIGATLLPIGPYFPGYTVTAAVTGLLYGLFFSKSTSPLQITLCVVVKQIISSLLLNTFWIALTSGTSFWALLPTRVFSAVVVGAAEIILLPLVAKYLQTFRQAARI